MEKTLALEKSAEEKKAEFSENLKKCEMTLTSNDKYFDNSYGKSHYLPYSYMEFT